MIDPLSLLPLSGALLSAALAATALLAGRRITDRLRWSFIGLTTSVAMWCFGSIIGVGIPRGVPAEASVFGTNEYWVFLLVVAGLVGSSTFFFFLAAAFTHRELPFTPGAIAIALLPLVGSMIAAGLNPWNHLYATPEVDGTIGYGPAMPPLFLGMYVLMIAGIAFMLRFQGGSAAARRQARIAAIAAIISTLAGLAWNLRDVIGLGLKINPAPTAGALFSAVLAWLVFSEGFGDIIPSVASMAFRHASDAALTTNEDLKVLAMNDAAVELFPRLSVGDDLAHELPELAAQLGEGAENQDPGTTFEISLGDRAFVGRARTTRPGTRSHGFVLLLTDVSLLREAEEALARIEEDVNHAGARPSRWER